MQKRFRRDDNGRQYMLIFSDKNKSKAYKEKQQFRKDVKQNKITVIVIKNRLAITEIKLKSICKKQEIDFSEGKLFTQEEYDLIKTYVVKERNKKLK